MNTSQSFERILEQYVFDVAAKFIGSVPNEDQDRLINLVNTIDKQSAGRDSPDVHLQKVAIDSLIDSPLEMVEEQWKEALKKPLYRKRDSLKKGRRVSLFTIKESKRN